MTPEWSIDTGVWDCFSSLVAPSCPPPAPASATLEELEKGHFLYLCLSLGLDMGILKQKDLGDFFMYFFFFISF